MNCDNFLISFFTNFLISFFTNGFTILLNSGNIYLPHKLHNSTCVGRVYLGKRYSPQPPMQVVWKFVWQQTRMLYFFGTPSWVCFFNHL